MGAWACEKAGSLSGGQQRLVEFARCLMLDPALVILDEPSARIAPKVLKTVFDAVRLMNGSGKTICSSSRTRGLACACPRMGSS